MPSNTRVASAQPDTSKSTNRSLERGIDLLRAFGPGATLLTNSELVERTGLPKATVSRLAATLVEAGFLEHDATRRAYRLGIPVLSVAQAMRSGSTLLQAAAPMMRDTAQRLHINVGIAGADCDEMVYLESVRYSPRASLRTVVSGQRVPMELTSLGRAWLAMQSPGDFMSMVERFRRRKQSGWAALEKDIADAVRAVHRLGYCVASWQPEVTALAAPLAIPGHSLMVLNFSVRTTDPTDTVVRSLAGPLLTLRDEIVSATMQLES
ncbi:IclR family transcriptional regulator [Burkholderia sp. Ac-20365]|uniref:IclR family transcriptional regulator n=1 Tax=Burkholderia sp. Ac-20365 TaxID=2703897 RepID=UPI00197C6C25|nr:IclR family transcriptional regulator [Burkholderia sp. Ac-20365]MBN3766569.1 IclR family transcriptional regulator [Burkholderia sp. Ac-20365]